MPPRIIAYSLFGIAVLFSFTSYSQRDWTSRKHKDGVEVFVKSQDDAVAKAYMAVASTSATIEKCVSFLLDFENHVNWRYSVTKVERLSAPEDDLIFYMIMDAPWPAEDRDVVIQVSKNELSPNKVEIVLTAVEGFKEKVEGFIRITNSITTWTFNREGDRTDIVYKGISDPGGKIPEWIINAGVVDAPFETLRNFITLVES